jgi:hypothetical protein
VKFELFYLPYSFVPVKNHFFKPDSSQNSLLTHLVLVNENGSAFSGVKTVNLLSLK